MDSLKLTLIIALFTMTGVQAQTVIGGVTPDASAILDIQSTSQGVLFPRLSETQRNAITAPATGLVLFNTTTSCLEINLGTPESPAWETIKCPPPPAAVTLLACNDASLSGSLNDGSEVTEASVSVTYTGGNGGTFAQQVYISSGVTGLTATLAAGSVASGNGSLSFSLSGTPSGTGSASFDLDFGGQICTMSVTVSPSLYPAGAVSCAAGPTAVVEVTSPVTGRIWMDRNMEASRAATSLTDADAAGGLFQWGRGRDGHQCRNSATQTEAQSSVDSPGHGDFILTEATPTDWRNPQENNLWQGASGVNNPCPSGFKVPSRDEFMAEESAFSEANVNGIFNSFLKLTITGQRNGTSGGFSNTGEGVYWTSTTADAVARQAYFHPSFNTFFSFSARAYGLAVRCIKDAN